MANIFLGVVADDFTGASDAASFLVGAGVPTVLFNGIPKEKPKLKDDTAAIVVALKTRTMPKDEAVTESMEAFAWLKRTGAEKLYLKYCSTFDSTSEGNIGPVADAVLETYQIPFTVVCPSLPVNGRIVREGKLYVNGILLEESHMRNHPLTPMRKSSIPELMEAQSAYPAFGLPVREIGETRNGPEHFYLVPDYYEDGHADQIAERYWELPFFTGGSGLVGALGRYYRKDCIASEQENVYTSKELMESAKTHGKALLLAGSCSAITLKQIGEYQRKGYKSLRIWPDQLLKGTQTEADISQWIREQGSDPLVYSSASPEELKESQSFGREKVAAMLEETISSLARKAVENGYTRIITAGGETSGAVTKALGYQAFYIGPSVAPGVPIMTPLESPELRLVLKSGNFGQEDFFERALDMTGGK